MKKCVFAAGLAVLTAFVALAAGTAGASRSADQLVGAGSTFVSPLVSQWVSDYPSRLSRRADATVVFVEKEHKSGKGGPWETSSRGGEG